MRREPTGSLFVSEAGVLNLRFERTFGRVLVDSGGRSGDRAANNDLEGEGING